MSYSPIDATQFCSFSASTPEDDWISDVYIANQRGEVLLDVSYGSFASTGYRDATDSIIVCSPGDILTISVTVNAGSSSWDQWLSWGHTVLTADLVTVADLYGGSGCPWTHTYDWEVPDETGTFLVSWWEHYGDYGAGCGDHSYAERQDYTLVIVDSSLEIPETTRIECKLTASGLDDLTLPVSFVTVRMRHQIASYMSWTLPDPLPWTDQIIARIGGNMLLYCAEPGEPLGLVLRTFLRNIYFTKNADKMILTLAGDRQISFASVIDQTTLEKIIQKRKVYSGELTFESAPDFSLTPRYTVDVGGGVEIVLDTVFFNIDKENATMTISGNIPEPPVPVTHSHWPLNESQGTFAPDIEAGLNGEIDGIEELTTWAEVGAEKPAQDYCLHLLSNPSPYGLAGVKTAYYFGSGSFHPMTLEAWVWLDSSASGIQNIISNLGHSQEYLYPVFSWYLGSTDTLRLMIENESTPGSELYNWATTNQAIAREEWTHLSTTIDDGQIRLYLNAVEAPLRLHGYEDAPGGDQPYPMRIGFTYQYGSFAGKIARVKIWPEIRTPAQLLESMNG